MMKRFRILVACLAVASVGVVAAGCGSSDSGSSGGGGGAYGGGSKAASTTTTAAKPAPAAGKTVAISMKNIAFNPPTVQAKVGQVVTWTNDDTVAHNVNAVQGEEFKSAPTIPPGGKYAYKIDKVSTIKYVCKIHPGMSGSIVVTK